MSSMILYMLRGAHERKKSTLAEMSTVLVFFLRAIFRVVRELLIDERNVEELRDWQILKSC